MLITRHCHWASLLGAGSALVMTTIISLACGDDGVAEADASGSSTSGTDSTGADATGTTTTDGVDSTGGDTTGGDLIPNPPTNPLCNAEASGILIEGGPFVAAEPEEFEHFIAGDDNISICPGDLLLDLEGQNLRVRVYRPDEWPDGPVPFVVHHHGAGQTSEDYEYIGNRLAEEGYVFLSVTNDGAITGSAAEQAIACTMSWIGSTEPEGGAALFTFVDEEENVQSRLRCDAIIMGHSQGGNAARRFVRNRDTEFWSPYWFGFHPAAFVGLAPSFSDPEPLPPELAVPMLLFGAGFDGDTGVPVTIYDQTPVEEERLPQSPARHLVWVQDAMHDSFGGTGGMGGPAATASAATAAVAEYLPRFLQWQLEGENIAENRRVLQFEEFPEPLNNPSHHDNADSYGELGFRDCSGLDDTACPATVGCFWDESAMPAICIDLVCADHATPTDCAAMSGCVEWDGDCVPRPAIYGAYTIDTTTADTFVERVEYFPASEDPDTTLAGSLFDAGQAITGDVLTDFMPEFMGTGTGHETSAMLVSWGPGENTPEGSVSLMDLTFDEDVATATHISFRIANLVTECEPSTTDPVSVGVRLRNDPGQDPAYVDSPLAPVQRTHTPFGGSCAAQTMSTVRIPFSRFCQDDMLDTSAINEIEFFFDDHDIDRDIIIDSIEFTRHPLDVFDDQTDTLNVCPLFSAVYACPATNTLVAEQTACSAEPISGACPGPDIVTTPVSIPWADDGGSGFAGWVIHASTGIIDDEESLSGSELEYLQARCVQACEDEWDDDPFIAANCDASGAFATPYLVTTPSVGTRQAIPIAQQDGSGLFTGQTLECSLHYSCCQSFDELGICPAAPARVTPARDRLGDGQEWELTLLGSTFADSSYAAEPVEAAMAGTIGYSFCTAGDGVDCPFYLGSIHLELTETLELELDCGESTEVHELTELAFDLVQPALGIGESGTSWKAFPPRAIVVEATGVADELPVYVRGPIELPIDYQAGEGWTQLQGEGGSYIELDVPCNGEIATVKLWWGFSEDAVIAAPPIVDVDLPDTVSCPDELPLLLATGDDPDEDLASLEWIVDGVLMSETWPTIDFTQAHEITAVLRDERGAATSDTKTVTCE
jgi:dienelactone hydrolase